MSKLETDIENWIEEAYDGTEICKNLAAHLTSLGYTRTSLTEAQREAEAKAIIKGFLDCPEIADCAPEDKEGDTHSLESRARRFINPAYAPSACAFGMNQGQPSGPAPKPARRVVQGWLTETCTEDEIAERAIQGWEPYQAMPVPGTMELLYLLKRPIPGDEA